MPILAFMREAVPDLLPLYASQIFKAILPSQLKYCVTVLAMTRYSGLYISYLSEIIQEIAFGKRHDPGTRGRLLIVEDKKTQKKSFPK